MSSSRVRNDRNHSTKPKARPFEEREPFRVLNQNLGNGIQTRQGHQVHTTEVRHIEAVLPLELPPELFPIDFDRAEPFQQPKSGKPAKRPLPTPSCVTLPCLL